MTRRQNNKLGKIARKEHYKAERRKILAKYRVGLTEQQASTFSKKWTAKLTTLSAIWVSVLIISIVASGWLGLSDAALTVLGIVCGAIITEIVVVLWKYMTKAYQGKKAEEEIKLEREKLNISNIVNTVISTVSGSDVVEDTTGREG